MPQTPLLCGLDQPRPLWVPFPACWTRSVFPYWRPFPQIHQEDKLPDMNAVLSPNLTPTCPSQPLLEPTESRKQLKNCLLK